MHNILAKILLLLIWLPAQGQSLRHLAEEALDANYSIRILRNEEQMASNRNTAGNAGMLPSVGIEGSFSRNINNTKQQFFITEDRVGTNAQTDNTNLRALANWTVFSGFRIQANRDLLQKLEELGSAETQFYIEQTVLDLADLYYQLTSSEALVQVYQEALALSRARLRLEQRRREIGASGASAFNQSLLDYQNDSAMVIAESHHSRLLQIQILQTLRREPSGNLSPVHPVWYPSSPQGTAELRELARNASTDIRRARITEMISDAQFVMARSAMYPEVNLYGGYAFSKLTNEVGFLKSSRNYGPEFGLHVRFNLFDGGRVRTETENASLSRENARLSQEQIKTDLDAAIQIHYENVRSLDQRIRLAEQSIEIADESVRIARLQIEQSTITGIDFRIVQLELIRARANLISLRQAHALSTLHLLRMSGGLIQAVFNS